jgi:hypothetical protein
LEFCLLPACLLHALQYFSSFNQIDKSTACDER